jgi:hypothetical protein
MAMPTATQGEEAAVRHARWLLLIHRLPPTPAYLRVKVRRRLHKLGAQPLKNSVYILPNRAESLEDLHWLRREILDAGGEATVSLAVFVEGTSDAELEEQFRGASEAEYVDFVRATGRFDEGPREGEVRRLYSQLQDVMSRDFFAAPGRAKAERSLAALVDAGPREDAPATESVGDGPVGATWVTRRGVHVDRMACAWLIRRFIDPAARFKFVPAQGYEPEPGELRFDMFEGEYTHEGDRCTFQTLVARFGLAGSGLDVIGEIVHDIDYKLEASAREETAGVRVLIGGICLAREGDEERLDAAGAVFDGIYAHFAGTSAARPSGLRAGRDDME